MKRRGKKGRQEKVSGKTTNESKVRQSGKSDERKMKSKLMKKEGKETEREIAITKVGKGRYGEESE